MSFSSSFIHESLPSGLTSFIYKRYWVLELLAMLVYALVLFFLYLLLEDNWLILESKEFPIFGLIGDIQGLSNFAIPVAQTRLLKGTRVHQTMR